MGTFRSLTGQTAYYGLSTMAGRLLNYLLVPLWSTLIVPPQRMGVVHYLYALAALLNVLLTYGMETAFFRYSSDPAYDRRKVSNTAFTSLFISTTIFSVAALMFYRQLADWINYSEQTACVLLFILIVALDTYAVIPFAQLRLEGKALRYAVIRLGGIVLTICLNLLLIYFLPRYGILEIDVRSIFAANVAGSALVLALFAGQWRLFSFRLDKTLWKKMLRYGWPILIAGMAYVVNETMDRVFLRRLLPPDVSEYWLGVYGTCFKLAIFITLFVQAFRLAVEPFFFSHAKEQNARQTYAAVTLYFTVAITAIYVGIMGNLSWLQYFVGREYRVGIGIVPIILYANIFLGLYYNLSMWYKLTDRTRWGAYISVLGAVVTIGVIFYGIPRYGYIAAAWSHLAAYGVMMLASYFFGQRFYPIPYRVTRILAYLLSAWGTGYLAWYVLKGNIWTGNLLFAGFCIFLYIAERKNLKKVFSK